MRKPDLYKNNWQQVLDLHEKGLCMSEIALESGMSNQIIRFWFQKNNIKPNPHPTRKTRLGTPSKKRKKGKFSHLI